MTTNSPNPVDGDVQALIEYCQRVLHGSNNGSQMEQVYQIALATLTAEPDVMISQEGAEAIRAIINREMSAAGRTVTFKQPSGIGEEKMMPLYTTPPAQLLRPVELPQGRLMQVAFETDPVNADMCLCISRDAAVRAIQSAGVEVKE